MAARRRDPEPERVRDAFGAVQTGGDMDRQRPSPSEFTCISFVQDKLFDNN